MHNAFLIWRPPEELTKHSAGRMLITQTRTYESSRTESSGSVLIAQLHARGQLRNRCTKDAEIFIYSHTVCSSIKLQGFFRQIREGHSMVLSKLTA
jgi:hypothetical protein